MSALANRAELRTGILAELGFVNGEIADSVANVWIALCEADLNRRLRVVPRQETDDLSFAAGSDQVAVPSGFRQLEDMYLDTTPRSRVLLRDIGQLRALQVALESGRPRYVAVKGDSIADVVLVVAPVPDVAYTGKLTYWKAFSLDSDSETNTILSRHPDAYLYGSLIHAEPYLGNDPRIPTWQDLYFEAIASITDADLGDWKSDQGAAA